MKKAKEKGSIANEPGMHEAINVSLEMGKYRWLSSILYTRDAAGKVVSFDEPRILSSDSHVELGGRIFGTLDEIPVN